MNLNDLQHKLTDLIENLTEENYQEHFKAGYHLIVDHKRNGGEQQETYDKLLPLFSHYQDINEQKCALIGDWLDCICGYVGNKEWYVWSE